MKVFTVHTRPAMPPVLVREGFSWGAAFFQPVWFALHGAWVVAAIDVALLIADARFAPRGWASPVGWTLAAACGLFGRDLLRWSLDQRGFRLAQVVTAPDRDTALGRVLDRRPDMVALALGRAAAE